MPGKRVSACVHSRAKRLDQLVGKPADWRPGRAHGCQDEVRDARVDILEKRVTDTGWIYLVFGPDDQLH